MRHLEAAARNGRHRASLDVCTELADGTLTYRILHEDGSGFVRKRVLIAALETEANMRRDGGADRAALDPRNYTFSADSEEADGVTRVVLHPLRKETALIDGAIFLESDGNLLRVEGTLAKSPSFWTRRVQVVRRYARIGSVRVPVSMESTADVRIVGISSFSMTYDYLAINGVPLISSPECFPGT